MIPGSGGGEGLLQVGRAAAHRRSRKRSPLTRAVAAGGAVICIGAAYEVTAPTVHALSIVFRAPDGNGNTNETRINVLQGNIFDPQLGILGANVSNNSTSGAGAFSTSNNPLVNNIVFNNPVTRLINSVLNYELVIGGAGAGPVNNATQISFLSFNIFNPQASIFGGNLSNNTTNANIADGLGNNSSASVTSIPNLWTSWFGGMAGNGNVLQLAFFSGNIFNPQGSIFGPNVSNNTAVTNSATNNGNYSQAGGAQGGGLLGAVARLFLGGMSGNGNTTQVAGGTSNITNPQVSLGGSNQSNNTAVTNEAIGNGNESQTTTGGLSIGTTGNGNTSQTAIGSGNIENTQVSALDVGLSPRPTELSGSQTTTALASTSTTPTTSSVSATESRTSSSVEPSGSTSSSSTGTSAIESSGSTTGSGTTTTSGTTGTSGTSGSAESGGSGGSGSTGGSGGG
jgi:hypothetical protein